MESADAVDPKHSYHLQRSDSRLTYYVAGYVARKCVLKTKCQACKDQLLLPATQGKLLNAAVFTDICDFGGLLYPSVHLFRFISNLEDIFTGCFSAKELHNDSVMDVLALVHKKHLNSIGCDQHCKTITANLVGFYLVTRMNFYIKGLNKSCDYMRKRAQHLKLSRL